MNMSFRMAIGLAFTVWLTLLNTVSAQPNTKKGAVLGGLSGAAIGAIIGDHNHEAGAGAAIGGAIGAVAGGVLGSSADEYDQAYRYQQVPQPVAVPRAIAIGDVVAMTQNRVSDPVIISAIQSNGIQRPLDVPDIVYLSQQGVSDAVIRVMQNAGNAPVVVARPVSPARTVVIDRYPVPPVYYPYPYPRRSPPHYHHTGRRSNSGMSISFGTRF
jgi:hypothetical protein